MTISVLPSNWADAPVGDIYYVALDPGDTTGWAAFDEAGELLCLGQFTNLDQTRALTHLISNAPNLLTVVVEDYRNYKHKTFGYGNNGQKGGSRNQTSKNIGKIELITEMRDDGVKCVLQGASFKPIGYRWGGLPGGAPSNHAISHCYDAYAHGIYFLQLNGIRKPGQGLFGNDS